MGATKTELSLAAWLVCACAVQPAVLGEGASGDASEGSRSQGGTDVPIMLKDAGWEFVADLGTTPANWLWVQSERDVWIAGGEPSKSRLLRYDGQKVNVLVSPSPVMLLSVWGSGEDDVWVTDEQGSIYRFDGTDWSLFTWLEYDIAPAVGGTSRDDVWIAAKDTMIHWDGSTLERYPCPHENIFRIRALSPTEVWAGGSSGFLYHFDGTAWSEVPTANRGATLGLWASGPNDVWAGGYAGNREHWDGSLLEQTEDVGGSILAMAGTAASDVWAMGTCCPDAAGTGWPWASHFDGVAWQSYAFLGETKGGITDVMEAPNGDFFAVGWSTGSPSRLKLYVHRR